MPVYFDGEQRSEAVEVTSEFLVYELHGSMCIPQLLLKGGTVVNSDAVVRADVLVCAVALPRGRHWEHCCCASLGTC